MSAELPTRHVVQFSSGLSSYEAAKRVAARHGTAHLQLVFTDTLFEHPDNYRFLIEAAADVFGGIDGAKGLAATAHALPFIDAVNIDARKVSLRELSAKAMALIPGLTWLMDGRTPFDVYRDGRFLGNSRVAKCSEVLKRKVAARWRNDKCHPDSTVLYIGFGFNEQSRIEKATAALHPWRVEFPMDDPPYLLRAHLMQNVRERGIEPPRLYFFGFKHANCFGACCQAGQVEWARTAEVLPDVYAAWDAGEQGVRELLGADVSMLSDRRGGDGKRPLTLTQFRERIAADAVDQDDIGSCSCFSAGMESEVEGSAAR